MSQFKNKENSSAKYLTFADLLSQNQFYIPNYQRPYSWTKEQVKSLMESFDDFFYNENFYNDLDISNYIGSVIVLKKPKNSETFRSEYEIIDGQQRLTTIILLIIAIKNIIQKIIHIPENKSSLVGSFGQPKLQHYENELKNFTKFILKIPLQNPYNPELNSIKNFDPILESRKQLDRTNLKIIISESINSIKKNTNWFENYNFIEKYLEEKVLTKDNEFKPTEMKANKLKKHIDDLFKYFYIIMHRTIVLFNEVVDVENAFSIFQSINYNGLKLTSFDLVNGWIQEKSKNLFNDINFKTVFNNYESIVSKIENNRKNDLNKYLGYWISSNHNKFVGDNDIFRTFQNDFENNFKQNLGETIKQMTSAFEFLHFYFDSSNDDYNSKFITWMDRKKIIPLILLLENMNYAKDQKYQLINWVIKYSILELNLFNTSPGKFQYKILKIMNDIRDNISICFTPKDLILKNDDLKLDYEKYKSTKNIFENIVNKTLTEEKLNKTLLVMLFDKESELVKLDLQKINLEHMLPKKIKSEELKKEKWLLIKDNKKLKDSYTNCLGNLSLMSSKDNKIKSNGNFDKEKYENNNELLYGLKWNKINNLENLTLEKIDLRTSLLCQMMLEKDILDIYSYYN